MVRGMGHGALSETEPCLPRKRKPDALCAAFVRTVIQTGTSRLSISTWAPKHSFASLPFKVHPRITSLTSKVPSTGVTVVILADAVQAAVSRMWLVGKTSASRSFARVR